MLLQPMKNFESQTLKALENGAFGKLLKMLTYWPDEKEDNLII